MVVPKAAIYQTQTFYAKGKMKEVKQLVANLRGESLSSGKTETWSGKMLKIPPVSPSILDCSIIRVEYSLMVRMDPYICLPCCTVNVFLDTERGKYLNTESLCSCEQSSLPANGCIGKCWIASGLSPHAVECISPEHWCQHLIWGCL